MQNPSVAIGRWLSIALLGAFLSGCAPQLVREDAGGAWTQIPPGSTFTLNRPVQVPEDQARVFFRGGRVLSSGANMGPSCGLEVRAISRDGPQTVAAQTFRITRMERYWTQVASLGVPASRQVRFQLASAQDGGGGTPMIQEGYHFWLGADADPNVMRVTCLGMLDDMWRSRPITLHEIRAALGDLATLEIAGRDALSPGGKTSAPPTQGPTTMSSHR
jgi:hypothetical protein